MRVDLPSGNWIELGDHKSLTARQVRPIVAIVSTGDKGSETSFDAIDAFVSVLKTGSSFGDDFDVADMPWSDYMTLVKVVQPVMAEALGADTPTPDGAGDVSSPIGA